jgi:hypothetical protein
MPSTSLSSPLLSSSSSAYRAYPLRWYIAAVFVVFCVMQSAMWSFYSPISGSLMQVYGWSPYFIEWLGNTANITFCILVVPIGCWVDGRGMRLPMIVTIIALCINSGLRCLPRASLGDSAFGSISMAAMVFNGIAGTVETMSPPVLSALWFPVHERATATALMATANTLGTCVGFLTAFIVPPALANDCAYLSLPANCSDPPPPTPPALAASSIRIEAALTTVYFAYFAVCALTLIVVLIRFPDRPPVAPAASSALPRDLSLLAGVRALSKNLKFWLAVLCMSVPLGVYSAWLNVLNINLQSFSFSQQDSGWVGFGSALAGAAPPLRCICSNMPLSFVVGRCYRWPAVRLRRRQAAEELDAAHRGAVPRQLRRHGLVHAYLLQSLFRHLTPLTALFRI